MEEHKNKKCRLIELSYLSEKNDKINFPLLLSLFAVLGNCVLSLDFVASHEFRDEIVDSGGYSSPPPCYHRD